MKFIKRSNNWKVCYTIGEVMHRLGPQRGGKPIFWGHNDCMHRYLKNRFYYIKTAKRGWKKRNHYLNSESEILPQSVIEARNSNSAENINIKSELNSCVHDDILRVTVNL